MLIKQILQESIKKLKESNIEQPSLIARILLANLLNIEKEKLLIIDENQLEEKIKQQYNTQIQEIINGKPIQYITNSQEFMKLKFYVDENVLIPRADTEILVEQVINICSKTNKNLKILDLCTGSGIIAISIAKYVNNCELYASDISKNALEIAKKNAVSNNVDKKITFVHSNMFENLKDNFDIIVSNPPYIKTRIIKTLDKQVQNEPHIALDGGEDGLEYYKIIVKNARNYLRINGYLCVEIGYDQKIQVKNIIEKENIFDNIYTKIDLYGNDRIIIAKRR